MISSIECYTGTHQNAHWHGYAIADRDAFVQFLRTKVRDRLFDQESGFTEYLRGLDTTGMTSERIEQLLRSVPSPAAWEIGEALAESILLTVPDWKILWPWNMQRDRRSPQASLPGADLIGFCEVAGDYWLLIGEVKTSSEVASPPQVMNGRSGMAWQLERNVTDASVSRSLLNWFYHRCSDPEHKAIYRTTVTSFIKENKVLLIGALIRDTEPHETDLRSRGQHLGNTLVAPVWVKLFAWYLPVAIAELSALLTE